jgi:hypothetical protein
MNRVSQTILLLIGAPFVLLFGMVTYLLVWMGQTWTAGVKIWRKETT